MTNKKKNSNNSKTIYEVIIVAIFVLVSIIVWFNSNKNENNNVKINPIIAKESQNIELTNNEKIQIHYFDVGQADSILLISNSKTMLIDAGTNETGKTVVQNIKNLGINKIDYLVGTHPHEDHIGGLDDVINNFEIGTIFMPKIKTNTKTFEDVLDAISNKGLKIISPKQGEKFDVGNTNCEIMLCTPELAEEKDNLNLSSIVIRTTFNKQSYLFMGDAETENEKLREWPQTNVLKIGHHGSKTSSSEDFLNQILPQIAIIQVGKDNKYGLPKKETIDKLNKIGTLIYRTDENKNILLESDGINNKISFY